MQDNNEEVKPVADGCCGGKCRTPQDPTKCVGPCVQCEQGNGCTCEKKAESQIVVPEGLDIDFDTNTDDLKASLDKIFADAKARADANAEAEKEAIITGSNVELGDFVTMELPNGMTVKVHKDSHKSKQEDMNRLIEAAGGEVDCSLEDDEGNQIIIETETELALTPDRVDKANTEYRPGMLRDLKDKFYPQDASGAEAQARLEDRSASQDADERSRLRVESATSDRFQSHELWAALRQMSEAALKQQEESKVKRVAKGVEAPNKRVEVMWNNDPQSMFRIDWNRFSDPDFQRTVEKQLAERRREVRLKDGWTVSVPESVELDHREKYVDPDVAERLAEDKLNKIVRASYCVPDKARELRATRSKEAADKILAERERIRKLTDDIIPISPIENPSLIRRAVRTVRRTWKRLATARKSIVAWWRL